MKQGVTVQELSAEILRQEGTKADYVADTSLLAMSGDGTFVVKGKGHGVTENAHGQLSQFLGIPKAYYDRMRKDVPALLAENVNAWLKRSNAKRMVRTLDGDVRALLSDKYRRIDNRLIAGCTLPLLEGMEVMSCAITPDKMYIKAVNPRVTAEIKKGDVVQSGIVISNSEVGNGTVTVAPLVYRLVCTNGMIANTSGLRRRHVGRSGDYIDVDYSVLSDSTIEADNRALMAKIQDVTRATLDEAKFGGIVDTMREAQGLEVTGKDIPKVVELAGKEYGLLEKEIEDVLSHFITGGEINLFGISNAVTRASQDIESYDRATTLEEIGWGLLNMGTEKWGALNKAAA
jgi:hypothetical protein